jgi:hypothetical protein
LNVVALSGFAVLGLGHEAFWLIGAALETGYLALLATNTRFQHVIDAQDREVEKIEEAGDHDTQVKSLSPPRRERLTRIEERCTKIIHLHEEAETSDVVLDGNREALTKLSHLYLKLLVTQQNLESIQAAIVEEQLKRQIEAIQRELAGVTLRPSLRESKQATLRILQQRLANLDQREQSLEDIESDLVRVEAQIDLALENAGMKGGQTETISTNIKLVSHLLDDSAFTETFSPLDQPLSNPSSQTHEG